MNKMVLGSIMATITDMNFLGDMWLLPATISPGTGKRGASFIAVIIFPGCLSKRTFSFSILSSEAPK